MIKTEHIRLSSAAERLGVDSDTILIFAAEGGVQLYALLSDWIYVTPALAENEEMSIDPLYSLGDERPIVRDVSEFSECVLGRGASEEGVFVQRKKINDHFQALYSPLNCQVIAECL